MLFVTTFWPLTSEGCGETGFQTGDGPILGEDTSAKLVRAPSQDKRTLVPSFWIFNVGPEILMLLISKLFAVSLSPLEVPHHNRMLTQLIGKLVLSVPACV